jgi:hypothetical protein
MGDEYFIKRDKILERYNFIEKRINYFKNAGTIGGSAFAIISLGQPAGEVLMYGGIGTFSYFFGDSLNKLNNKLKENALKNLEKKFN